MKPRRAAHRFINLAGALLALRLPLLIHVEQSVLPRTFGRALGGLPKCPPERPVAEPPPCRSVLLNRTRRWQPGTSAAGNSVLDPAIPPVVRTTGFRHWRFG